jgi:hypothetical protein
VRALAAVMRRGVATWRRLEQEIDALHQGFALASELAGAAAELAELARDHERAAADLEARAELADAIERGEWSTLDEHAGAVARTERAWEDATSGGPDADAAITVTVSELADLESRSLPVVDPVAAALCAEDRWYREAGTLIGTDGQAYPLVVPNVRNPDARGDQDVFVFNDDWGRPSDAGVESLVGLDEGWRTAHVEIGAGRLGEGLGLVGTALAAGAGSAGARHLGATGRRPVPLEVYRSVHVDEWFVPTVVPYADGAGVEVPDPPDELAGVTPTMTVTAGGRVRFEATVPATGAAAMVNGLNELVNQVRAGTGNVRTLADRRNVGYAVEYQVHRDGRTRALARGHQLAVTGEGEILVATGYLGVGADGFGPLVATAPRINDGYAPTFNTNGVAPS